MYVASELASASISESSGIYVLTALSTMKRMMDKALAL